MRLDNTPDMVITPVKNNGVTVGRRVCVAILVCQRKDIVSVLASMEVYSDRRVAREEPVAEAVFETSDSIWRDKSVW